MTTQMSFNSTILSPSNSFLAFANENKQAARPTTKQPKTVRPMQASLWRHTLAENPVKSRSTSLVRAAYAVIGALSAGSIGYAAWATVTLMGGNHLQNAVALLMH